MVESTRRVEFSHTLTMGDTTYWIGDVVEFPVSTARALVYAGYGDYTTKPAGPGPVNPGTGSMRVQDEDGASFTRPTMSFQGAGVTVTDDTVHNRIVVSVTGGTGRSIEFQQTSSHVQWRYVGDPTWIDLVGGLTTGFFDTATSAAVGKAAALPGSGAGLLKRFIDGTVSLVDPATVGSPPGAGSITKTQLAAAVQDVLDSSLLTEVVDNGDNTAKVRVQAAGTWWKATFTKDSTSTGGATSIFNATTVTGANDSIVDSIENTGTDAVDAVCGPNTRGGASADIHTVLKTSAFVDSGSVAHHGIELYNAYATWSPPTPPDFTTGWGFAMAIKRLVLLSDNGTTGAVWWPLFVGTNSSNPGSVVNVGHMETILIHDPTLASGQQQRVMVRSSSDNAGGGTDSTDFNVPGFTWTDVFAGSGTYPRETNDKMIFSMLVKAGSDAGVPRGEVRFNGTTVGRMDFTKAVGKVSSLTVGGQLDANWIRGLITTLGWMYQGANCDLTAIKALEASLNSTHNLGLVLP